MSSYFNVMLLWDILEGLHSVQEKKKIHLTVQDKEFRYHMLHAILKRNHVHFLQTISQRIQRLTSTSKDI